MIVLIFEILKLLASIAVLLYSADKLITSASRYAQATGISPAVIGIVIIGYGTSLPEFAVSAMSSIIGHPGLAISNIVGSNIFNIAILIGLAAVYKGIIYKENFVTRRDIAVLIASAGALMLMLSFGVIGRLVGFIMAVAVITYTYYAIKGDKERNGLVPDKTISPQKEMKGCLYMLAAVLISSRLLIDASTNISRIMGISEWIIGATIVAAGTSMPELAVTVVSAKRQEYGIMLGNIVGSNIFNILWVIGFAAVLNPLKIIFKTIVVDNIVMVLITLLFSWGLIKKSITPIEGGAYILIYVYYLGHLMGAGAI